RRAELPRALDAGGARPRPRRGIRRGAPRLGLRRGAGAARGRAPRDRAPARPGVPPRPRRGDAVMRLARLVGGPDVRAVAGSLDVAVTGIAIASRAVVPGDVFFALAGRATDGRRHVAQALARGARAVVADGDVDAPGATVVASPHPRAVLARAA